jgi:2-iminobutanoate/2-iminopropanoate deaminase
MRNVLILSLAAVALMGAERQVIVAANAVKPVGPYSPGIVVGDYLYISGQGALDAAGKIPEGIAAQTRLTCENVRAIASAAGFTLADTVSVQLYLLDLANLPAVEPIYSEFFPAAAPRVTLGVARMPVSTPVEITVVLRKRAATSPRVYLPPAYGKTLAEAEAALAATLKARGLRPAQVVFRNHYAAGAREAGLVPIDALPGGARHALSAVAVTQAEPTTAWCTVESATGQGTLEEQTAAVFARLSACLARASLTLADIVATNVYLDDIGQFGAMNARYASFFTAAPPTRTTVQPLAPAGGALVRISGFAHRR